MNLRIARKIYKPEEKSNHCLSYQQALYYHGHDECCEEYGDKKCRKCGLFVKKFLNYSDTQIDKTQKKVFKASIRHTKKLYRNGNRNNLYSI